VALLLTGQESDGLWNGSPQETIRRLFGLHLTVRNSTPAITKALEGLAEEISAGIQTMDPRLTDPASFEGLPFVMGNASVYVRSAFLFLATIFEQQDLPVVRMLYEKLTADLVPASWLQKYPADLNNAMRALVVHPRYASHDKVVNIVACLAQQQASDGTWGENIPFFQMVNALAHLERPDGDAQLERAFHRLKHTQNDDGTWGRRQREWNTFLVIHALRNRGLL